MNHDRVMLLIDADNVSLDVIEQAVPWVHKHYGGPHVRRAYCTAESAVKHQSAFKRLGIRPMVNLAAGKNSTDIALAVDAIDLVVAEMPEVVVIASSDSDFAPLVSRLREKGCRVVGVGQSGKTGAETASIYDDYEVLVHQEGRARSAAPRTAARAAAPAKKAAAKAAPAPKPPTRKAAAKKGRHESAEAADMRAKAERGEGADVGERADRGERGERGERGRRSERSERSEKAAAAPAADRVGALLDAMPELARGEELDLRVAAERLRKQGLLSKRGSSTKLFASFPQHFVLSPPDEPQKVRAAR
jgi:uncharacterized protein (TIGR00288 family)